MSSPRLIHKSGGSTWTIQRQAVTVRVPATTANLGPGFDSIGMALDIWNSLKVELADKEQFEVFGEGMNDLPRDDTNLVIVGIKAAFKIGERMEAARNMPDHKVIDACRPLYAHDYMNIKLPTFKYTCVNHIPYARGLGSSSAAVVSGLVAGLVLLGIELPTTDQEALLNIACAIEGHPDNVAPAIYGGIQIGVKFSSSAPIPADASDDLPRWTTSQVPVPNGLQCVLFLPDETTETSKARAILPKMVSRAEAIFNISRCAFLVNSFASGKFTNLHVAMEDRLHQPYRAQAQATHLYPLVDAAVKAGAHCACLSGAGPAVLALTSGAKGDIFTQRQGERMDRAVADAMLGAANAVEIRGRIFITRPTQKGAHVESTDPPISEGVVCLFGPGGHV